MHFCLIFRSLETGGIQTLMARMAKWLAAQGHRVTVLAGEDGSFRSSLAPSASIVVDSRWYEALSCKGSTTAQSFLRSVLGGDHVDVFYCFSDEALWIAAGLLNAQDRPAKCLAGAYGPADYGIGRTLSLFPLLPSVLCPESHLLLHHLPAPCRLFMNDAIRTQVATNSRCHVSGTVWPLPVDGARYREIARHPERGLIVSVGRLVPTKEYNLWMINVVRDLVRDGFDIRWEVYGEGPYRSVMEDRVQSCGLEDRITLRGEIEYEHLSAAFCRADMFVGMGTSLIEAGLAGVPAIAAVVDEKVGMTYGFLHELPDYSCGEPVGRAMRPVAELVRQVMGLDAAGREELAEAQRAHASRFELDHLMSRFLDIVSQAPALDHIWRPTWHYTCATAYRALRANWHRLHGRRHSHKARLKERTGRPMRRTTPVAEKPLTVGKGRQEV
jgi:glycosyltransferase involved in cell wall biosynthesis